ncbi:DUF6783 domain-containing protein [Blautia sp.]
MPAKCDAHLAESLFQTRSRERMAVQFDSVWFGLHLRWFIIEQR